MLWTRFPEILEEACLIIASLFSNNSESGLQKLVGIMKDCCGLRLVLNGHGASRD